MSTARPSPLLKNVPDGEGYLMYRRFLVYFSPIRLCLRGSYLFCAKGIDKMFATPVLFARAFVLKTDGDIRFASVFPQLGFALGVLTYLVPLLGVPTS